MMGFRVDTASMRVGVGFYGAMPAIAGSTQHSIALQP